MDKITIQYIQAVITILLGVIGILLIFTGVVVGGLTPFLGEMPW